MASHGWRAEERLYAFGTANPIPRFGFASEEVGTTVALLIDRVRDIGSQIREIGMLGLPVAFTGASTAAYQQDCKEDASYKTREEADKYGGCWELIAMLVASNSASYVAVNDG